MMAICKQLGYVFRDETLLALALTHCSYSEAHNERIEFLGDAIVNMLIAEILYERLPHAKEGELSRYRAALVNRHMLFLLGEELQIGSYLRLGEGEKRSGGAHRESIISCAMEAVIGAIYLDGGLSQIKQRLLSWYAARLLQLTTEQDDHKDPKSRLQEYAQSRRLLLPRYEVLSIEGKAHEHIFSVSCIMDSLNKRTEGSGTSRRKGEQSAALQMLKELDA